MIIKQFICTVLTTILFFVSNSMYWTSSAFALSSVNTSFQTDKLAFNNTKESSPEITDIENEGKSVFTSSVLQKVGNLKNSVPDLHIVETATGLKNKVSDINLVEKATNLKNSVPDLHIVGQTQKLKQVIADIDLELSSKELQDFYVTNIVQKGGNLKNNIPNLHLSEKAQQLKKSISDQDLLAQANSIKQALLSVDMSKQLGQFRNSLSDINLAGKSDAIKNFVSGLDIPIAAKKVLSNVSMLKATEKFLSLTPENFCNAYNNYVNGEDQTAWILIEKGAVTAFTVFKLFPLLQQWVLDH